MPHPSGLAASPQPPCRGYRPAWFSRDPDQGTGTARCVGCAPRNRGGGCLTLTLFVAQVVADHHDPPVTADHFALVANLLDARLDLHVSSLLVAVDNAATGQVVGAQLDDNTVLGQDTDVVLPHLA